MAQIGLDASLPLLESVSDMLGWVSFFDPQALAELLGLPSGARPLGILCIGRVPAFYPRPMFEDAGWGKRLEISRVLFENRWPEGAAGTPTAY